MPAANPEVSNWQIARLVMERLAPLSGKNILLRLIAYNGLRIDNGWRKELGRLRDKNKILEIEGSYYGTIMADKRVG